jgi:hypothetical protein
VKLEQEFARCRLATWRRRAVRLEPVVIGHGGRIVTQARDTGACRPASAQKNSRCRQIWE